MPALGKNIELGMLFDARSSQFYSGLSLWDNADINYEDVKINNQTIQDSSFMFSYSLKDARDQVGLNVEGSLALDLGIISAEGSGKYLTEQKKSAFEARVNVTCTITHSTRRIPQELLASMKHERHLSDDRFTHFVSEVVKGSTATLSFSQECSSEDEMKHIVGALRVKLMAIKVEGAASVEMKEDNSSRFEKVNVSYRGAIAESVTTVDDAIKLARELPKKLMKQSNTLSYTVIPLSILDSSIRRFIRTLDVNMMTQTAAVVEAGRETTLILKFIEENVPQDFSGIKQQVMNFEAAYSAAYTSFTDVVRRLLPELRGESTNYDLRIGELRTTVALFEQRTAIARLYCERKEQEMEKLRSIVDKLIKYGFHNRLNVSTATLSASQPQLMFTFGGVGKSGQGQVKHPLQVKLESEKIEETEADDDDDDGADEDVEWYEDDENNARVMKSIKKLKDLYSHQEAYARIGEKRYVEFVFGSIAKAFRISSGRKSSAHFGDILLVYDGKAVVLTDHFPEPPTPYAHVKGQTITVTWDKCPSADNLVENYCPTEEFIIYYRPRPNPSKDGIFPSVTDNEQQLEKRVPMNAFSQYSFGLSDLRENCDYEISMSMVSMIGRSASSKEIIARTEKSPSAALELIRFYSENSALLSIERSDTKRWEMTEDAQPTLYLGHSINAERTVQFKGKATDAVRIVDVAAEFRPEINPAQLDQVDDLKVIVFVGTTGHGKTTQINSFVSFLLGGDLSDKARVMMIDDRRRTSNGQSVTQLITCYRLRPLSGHFQGKTLLIVDTPGYCDTRGVVFDEFITNSMAELFKTISYVNAIVFVCKACETRTTFLEPVTTFVYSLFAKNVRSCLRTIFTFSDAGKPKAREVLEKLEWPVDKNKAVEVNNGAFDIAAPENADDPKIRDHWQMSMRGQHRVLDMLMKMSRISLVASEQVVTDRMKLEEKCELVEKIILNTANKAQILLANLGAIAKAVGASPGEKVTVTVIDAIQEPVPLGKATTLCISCNATCHEICVYGDDNDKMSCAAMNYAGYCTVCPKRCHWTYHKNARFIIKSVESTKQVVPEDLIKLWNANNNTLEGALLDDIDKYSNLQETLRNDIHYLADLTNKLMNNALLHSPESLINYVDTLIKAARARGAPAEQLHELMTAKTTLALAVRVKDKSYKSTINATKVLEMVLSEVRQEMKRRTEMNPNARAAEEEKPCDLYNKLYDKLPNEILHLVPEKLKKRDDIASKVGYFFGKTFDVTYSENLSAIVTLVQVILKHGGVQRTGIN